MLLLVVYCRGKVRLILILPAVASYVGAWIEVLISISAPSVLGSHLMWVRGLKCF